jgi:hypothetical protein
LDEHEMVARGKGEKNMSFENQRIPEELRRRGKSVVPGENLGNDRRDQGGGRGAKRAALLFLLLAVLCGVFFFLLRMNGTEKSPVDQSMQRFESVTNIDGALERAEEARRAVLANMFRLDATPDILIDGVAASPWLLSERFPDKYFFMTDVIYGASPIRLESVRTLSKNVSGDWSISYLGGESPLRIATQTPPDMVESLVLYRAGVGPVPLSTRCVWEVSSSEGEIDPWRTLFEESAKLRVRAVRAFRDGEATIFFAGEGGARGWLTLRGGRVVQAEISLRSGAYDALKPVLAEGQTKAESVLGEPVRLGDWTWRLRTVPPLVWIAGIVQTKGGVEYLLSEWTRRSLPQPVHAKAEYRSDVLFRLELWFDETDWKKGVAEEIGGWFGRTGAEALLPAWQGSVSGIEADISRYESSALVRVTIRDTIAVAASMIEDPFTEVSIVDNVRREIREMAVSPDVSSDVSPDVQQ